MTTKTIEVLLELQGEKNPSADELMRWMKNVETEAEKLKSELSDAVGAGNTSEVKRLNNELQRVKNEMQYIDGIAKKQVLAKSLENAKKRAEQLKNQMEKIQMVGNNMAIAGATVLAPFVMAANKYVTAMGDSEETSARMLETQKKWEQIQVRIGRVAAEQILPFLEKALDLADGIAAFAEAHPDAVKAAIAIGGSLVVVGGFLSVAATIVKTLSTVGLLAQTAGAFSAVGASGAVAGGGLSASISAGIAAAAPYLATALAVGIAAELTRVLMNGLLGTNQTWADIGKNFERLLVISGEGWDGIFTWLGMDTNFSASIANALGIADVPTNKQVTETAAAQTREMRDAFANAANVLGNGLSSAFGSVGVGVITAIGNLPLVFSSVMGNIISRMGFAGGKADGGYAALGRYTLGERGTEFVMANGTTRAAENIIGGKLSQVNLIAALASGGGRRINYNDHRRIDSRLSSHDRDVIRNDILDALSGAF